MKKNSVKLNSASVKKSFMRFLACFVVLMLASFLVVYFFFKSNAIQHENIQHDILVYKETLNRQQILKSKIDTIYYQMSLLNTGKVRNDVFLRNYISQNIQDTKRIIDVDSSSAFKHYAFMLSKLDTMLVLKNEITLISDKERLALRDLNECVGRMGRINSELLRDPTRGYR